MSSLGCQQKGPPTHPNCYSTRQGYTSAVDATLDSHQCYMVNWPEDIMGPEGWAGVYHVGNRG